MANQWVRLWIDMPTDPKWRVISKISKQPLTSIISVYVCLLTNAANAMKRGVTQCNAEEIAATLDLENDHVEEIFKAMQGRVLDGEILTGWEKRQPKREDDSRERVSKSRSNKNVTQCNAQERNVTQCNAPDTDTDTDTDTENTKKNYAKKKFGLIELQQEISEQSAIDLLALRKAKRAPLTATAWAKIKNEIAKTNLTTQEAVDLMIARGWQGFNAGWVKQENAQDQKNDYFDNQHRLRQISSRVAEHANGNESNLPIVHAVGSPLRKALDFTPINTGSLRNGTDGLVWGDIETSDETGF